MRHTIRLVACVCVLAGFRAPGQEAVTAPALFQARDGRELSQWGKWGDPGDQHVELSEQREGAHVGTTCLRAAFELQAGAAWWPAVGFEFPVETRWASVDAVALWVKPRQAVAAGVLNLSIHGSGKVLASMALPALEAGQWQQVLVRGTYAKVRQSGTPWRLKVAANVKAVSQAAKVELYLDGLKLLPASGLGAQISELKDLHLDTVLVRAGQPGAVIVAPGDGRYAGAVTAVNAAIRTCAGIELAVQRDADVTTTDLLRSTNVIAVGNLSTNRFIETLYCEYYTMADCWYPGKGGYEVRSLHNPYGTGFNVIVLGGSDDAGVAAAAQAFASELRPADPSLTRSGLGSGTEPRTAVSGPRRRLDGSLTVGWLLKVKLGEGMNPPSSGETVYSWHDSFRLDSTGKQVGYKPSTAFCWNPISTAAALYYMTGRKEHLDQFVRLALPDPDHLPKELLTDSSIYNPRRPLVENYHYHVSLIDLLWDLTEESPLLTDGQRLAITNELLDHQNHFDPNDSFTAINGSRHGLWHMNCIYTGSRYFAKYYPAPRWEKRIANARKTFGSFIGNATWGELDTLTWVNTSMEPVFDFFMLDGYEQFVSSGTARTMIGALEILWSGKQSEESNKCQSINLMRKAAHMLEDGRYLYMADAAGYDFSAFRVGQSFAPPAARQAVPPLDRVGRVSAQPLARTTWERSGQAVPLEQGFQFLSFRSGVTRSDDFLQVDGFYGRGRTPYHVNALYTLRMGGILLLHGYENQVAIRRQGMVEPAVPRTAALEAAHASGRGCYLRSSVPNMPFATWTRHLLYLKEADVVVLDEVAPRLDGVFDVTCGWHLIGPTAVLSDKPRSVQASSGATLACSRDVTISPPSKGRFQQQWSVPLRAERVFTFGNLVYRSGKRGEAQRDAAMLGQRSLLLTGTSTAVACFGGCAGSGLQVEAEAAYVSSSAVFVAKATRLTCERPLVSASKPVTVFWDLSNGALEVVATEPTTLELATSDPDRARLDLDAGRHALADCQPAPDAVSALGRVLAGLRPAPDLDDDGTPVDAPDDPIAQLTPRWTLNVGEPMAQFAVSRHTAPAPIWAVAGGKTLCAVSSDGRLLHRVALESESRALWAAASPAQAREFAALVGCDDDTVIALDAGGRERWRVKAQIAPKFRIGERYDAPWFTDPAGKHGVFSILVADFWGAGREEIALGRSSTVELRSLDGELLKRLPTHWGDNTALALLRADDPRLLVGKFFTGQPGVSSIGPTRDVLGDSGYLALPSGATSMNAWMQRGVSHLITRDLEGDGTQEVVVARSGHWNEVAAYRPDGTCLWLASFGPAPSRSKFIRSVVVADLDGDTQQEVAVGMDNGWVCAFDSGGEALWQRRLTGGVRGMCRAGRSLVVGDASGRVTFLGSDGVPTAALTLSKAVTAVAAFQDGDHAAPVVVAATAAGDLVAVDVPGNTE